MLFEFQGHTEPIQTVGGGVKMAFPNQNQCIHCDVKSCKHHSHNDMCELNSIKVSPREGCNSGECDESLCSSYHTK